MSTNFLINFNAGDKIKASETNSNNQYILEKINEEIAKLDTYLKTELAKFSNNLYAIGDIKSSAADLPDMNWLECDGTELSREEYSTLFDKIGTTFGEGNAVTTFNIPDLRGVVIRGLDNGRGLDPERSFGSYQEDALQQHQHDFVAAIMNRCDPKGDWNRSAGYSQTYTTQGVKNAKAADETRMKNVALKFFIKVK